MPGEDNPTPLVRLNRLNTAADFPLYAKLEWMNPFGSVKDRAAWALLRELEENGELGNGRGIVEPTSGNTGISLAAMALILPRLTMRAVVPNKVPLKKKVLLKFVVRGPRCGFRWSCAPGTRGSVTVRSPLPIPTRNLRATSTHDAETGYQKPHECRSAFPYRTVFEIWLKTEGRITVGTCGTAIRAGKSPEQRSRM